MVSQNSLRMIVIIMVGLILISSGCPLHAAVKKAESKSASTVMTQAELQAQVMSFADRYFSILVAAFTAYQEKARTSENYNRLLSLCTYSASSAFTIAAGSNPVGALLDMTVMVTLGRIVFQEDLPEEFGPQLEPLTEGFQAAEKDIWQVAGKILTPAQQQELHTLIQRWRRDNPKILFFPSIRFSDFSAHRTEMDKEEASGLLKSVENAAQQVEEVRLLAERGMFLTTRMPMLTGLYAGVWFSQLANHPDVEKILKNVDDFSDVSKRLADFAEQLPDKFASEREKTIRQLADEFSAERKKTIDDLLREEQRIRGLLSELRLTLNEGNKLILSTDSLIKHLDRKPGEVKAVAPAKPFDIKEYQDTLKEASNTIIQAHGLVKTIDQVNMEKVIKVVDAVEKSGEKWLFWVFLLATILILIFLSGSIAAVLIYRRLVNRIDRSSPPGVKL